jgi:ketosteroid isomerase-like protein
MSAGRSTAPAAITRLIDKEAVRETIATYARSVDRCDFELMRSCFWDDAIDVHGFMVATPDELVEAAQGMLSSFESTMHFLGNSMVSVDGDEAHAETYCIAYHHIVCGERGDYDRVVGMRIVDRLQRRGDDWRFAKRTYIFEWGRVDPAAVGWKTTLAGTSANLDRMLEHWPLPADAIRGRRDRADPSYVVSAAGPPAQEKRP